MQDGLVDRPIMTKLIDTFLQILVLKMPKKKERNEKTMKQKKRNNTENVSNSVVICVIWICGL
jgi:hypothetical protein